jgi:hypothetical protein
MARASCFAERNDGPDDFLRSPAVWRRQIRGDQALVTGGVGPTPGRLNHAGKRVGTVVPTDGLQMVPK